MLGEAVEESKGQSGQKSESVCLTEDLCACHVGCWVAMRMLVGVDGRGNRKLREEREAVDD